MPSHSSGVRDLTRAEGANGVTAATIEPAPGGRAVEIFGNHYTVALPKLSEPRMHVAAVLLSVQVLGQTVLGFDLSIAQILLTLGLCAAIDIPMTMWDERRIAWPASALLTGKRGSTGAVVGTVATWAPGDGGPDRRRWGHPRTEDAALRRGRGLPGRPSRSASQ